MQQKCGTYFWDILLKLYKSLVRPILDYSVQAWRPYLQKDIDVLERVQRRATRMVEGCEGMYYRRRLLELQLTTLETRRERADMIEVFKICKGLEGVKEEDFFVRQKGSTRANEFKIFKKRLNLDLAKYSFGNRVINNWNKLPNSVVQATSVDAFKGRLDKFMGATWGLI